MSRELQNPSSASEGLLDKRETEEYAPLGHNTKELQAARHQAFLRAIYAEFTGTFIFFSMILGPIAKCYLAGVDPTLAAIILHTGGWFIIGLCDYVFFITLWCAIESCHYYCIVGMP
jgi:hypothetical protein